MSPVQQEDRRVRAATVAVVDPRPGDYAALLGSHLGSQVRLQFLGSGRDALRLARTGGVTLWVINADLPDMSGLDLCSMLRTCSGRSVVYVVTDEYRMEDERAARLCGASFFGCKPVEAGWFDDWPRPP